MRINRIISFKHEDSTSPMYVFIAFNDIRELVMRSPTPSVFESGDERSKKKEFIKNFGIFDSEVIFMDSEFIEIKNDTRFFIITIPLRFTGENLNYVQFRDLIFSKFENFSNLEPSVDNLKENFSSKDIIDDNDITITSYTSRYELLEVHNIKEFSNELEHVVCELCCGMNQEDAYYFSILRKLKPLLHWINVLGWIPLVELYYGEKDYDDIYNSIKNTIENLQDNNKSCSSKSGKIFINYDAEYNDRTEIGTYKDRRDFMFKSYFETLVHKVPEHSKEKYLLAFILETISSESNMLTILFNYISISIPMYFSSSPTCFGCINKCETSFIQYRDMYREMKMYLSEHGKDINEDEM